MFQLRENIYVSKLRLEMEPTDIILKRLIAECYNTNTQVLFSSLAEHGRKFWHEFPNAMIIIMEWANQLNDVLAANVNFFEEDLKIKIWKNFLCRLSLDSWLIVGKGQHSHGNKILKIFMLVVRDIIYSQLPLKLQKQTEFPGRSLYQPIRDQPTGDRFSHDSSATEPERHRLLSTESERPRLSSNPPPAYNPLGLSDHNPYGHTSDLFGLGDRIPRANVRMPNSTPTRHRSIDRIPEDNEENEDDSDEELKELRNSTNNVYLPKSSQPHMSESSKRGGMAIKIKKSSHGKEESSNKSRSRKKSHKKQKKSSRKEEESSESDSESERD
jgi:hypothetical protein